MIEGINLTYAIADHTIFEGATLSIPPRGLTSLHGPSGCGKTTMLNILGLLLPPTSGTVLIGGRVATDWSSAERRRFWRDEAAFIYQDSGVINDHSVAYNVTLSRRATKRESNRVDEILALVGLASRQRDRAGVLSGGEKQRLGIARAIYTNATWIFADEPTASLDAANRAAVTDMFRRLADAGAGIVTATHDRDLIDASDTAIDLSRQRTRP